MPHSSAPQGGARAVRLRRQDDAQTGACEDAPSLPLPLCVMQAWRAGEMLTWQRALCPLPLVRARAEDAGATMWPAGTGNRRTARRRHGFIQPFADLAACPPGGLTPGAGSSAPSCSSPRGPSCRRAASRPGIDNITRRTYRSIVSSLMSSPRGPSCTRALDRPNLRQLMTPFTKATCRSIVTRCVLVSSRGQLQQMAALRNACAVACASCSELPPSRPHPRAFEALAASVQSRGRSIVVHTQIRTRGDAPSHPTGSVGELDPPPFSLTFFFQHVPVGTQLHAPLPPCAAYTRMAALR